MGGGWGGGDEGGGGGGGMDTRILHYRHLKVRSFRGHAKLLKQKDHK